LYSVYHDRSSLITEIFMLGHQIIVGKAQWRSSLLLYGEFTYIPLLLGMDGASACML